MAVYQISLIHLVVLDFWIHSCLLRPLPGFAFSVSATQVGKVKSCSAWYWLPPNMAKQGVVVVVVVVVVVEHLLLTILFFQLPSLGVNYVEY